MTSMRIYNSQIRPVGTIKFGEGRKFIGLQFGENSTLYHKFKDIVADFLKQQNLKIVSDKSSFRKHNLLSIPDKSRDGFDVYYKVSKSKNGNIELKQFVLSEDINCENEE